MKLKHDFIERNQPKSEFIERLQSKDFKGFKPGSLDEKTRSVGVIAATETPVRVWDSERWEEIDEVLLMEGCELPEEGKIPVTVQHYNSAEYVIGSLREMEISGNELIGRTYFSEAEDAEPFYVKVKEGHLDRFSVVYPIKGRESVYIAEGETSTVKGKEYEGPILVTTRWQPKALGLVMFPADNNAKARSKNTNKEETMSKLLELLIKRGLLPEGASEADALKLMERLELKTDPTPEPKEPESKPKEPKVNIDEELARAATAERERVLEINAMCQRFSCDDMAEKLIKDGKTIDVARQQVLDHLGSKKTDTPGYRAPVMTIADEQDKFRSAASDALMIRAGLGVEKPSAGADELTGYSLTEMARHCLRMGNKPTGGHAMEMIGRALIGSDLPLLLANVANKSLAEGWKTAPETWRQWCHTGKVNDFKIHSKPRASETDDLEEITDQNKYKYGEISEAQEKYSIATFGKLFALTRKTIIDDDLDSLSDIPFKHGEAAARKVGDVVYSVLTANAAMGDGVALFHENHSNILTTGAINETTLAEGIKEMKLQKDIKKKRRLGIQPGFIIAPVSLEGAAEVFFNSTNWASDNKAATRVNPYSGSKFTRIYESRLDDDSDKTWYMLSYNKRKTVTMFFLQGIQEPYLETKNGWSIDGVEYKVRIDVGAKAMDWRGMSKNAGA